MTNSLIKSIVSLLFLVLSPPPPSVVELTSPAAAGSGEANLAVAADGRVFMSWLAPATAGQGHVLRFSVRGPQGWSGPQPIAHGRNWFANPPDGPSLAVMR